MLFISSPRRDPPSSPPSPSSSPAETPHWLCEGGRQAGAFLGAALRVGRLVKHPEQAVGQWEGFSLSRVAVPSSAIPEDDPGMGSCLWASAALPGRWEVLLEAAWIRESCSASGALINGMLLLPLPPTHFHFHFTCGTQPCNSQPGHK